VRPLLVRVTPPQVNARTECASRFRLSMEIPAVQVRFAAVEFVVAKASAVTMADVIVANLTAPFLAFPIQLARLHLQQGV
jgi:hypothetical protein